MDVHTFYQDLPRLTSARLVLRKIRPADAPAYFAILAGEFVTRQFPSDWGPPQPTAQASPRRRTWAMKISWVARPASPSFGFKRL